ncbi:MAG: molecular chaperone HtpG [Oscillospiraceae bacterium]|nr:molecular chaperone HtpG [Oscillospiraceae bacterium]
MAKKVFKAESKRLLDLMINSIYTHKEIFLRELISNASDALDKRYYISLTDESQSFDRDDFWIRIDANKDSRTLTITDTGVGMSREDLEKNLGTIAHSGSFAFKGENEPKDGVEIIGQFGVGFYSAFMVADSVVVKSRVAGLDECYEWKSDGPDGYTINPCEPIEYGTQIVLTLKPDADEERYGEFLEEYRLRGIVKKYSDFIKYPIKMEVKKHRPKEDGEADDKGVPTSEEYTELETLNSMVPIWRKNKSELSQEDYDRFYQDKHFGFEKPLRHIHMSVDGAVSYTALLYIPSSQPYDFYTREFEKGLELYTSGVLIMQKCADLLPDHFSFVQGLADSADLSLNISRELLQHDRQLKIIAKRIAEKVKSELLNMLQNDRESYEKFFGQFGRQLKYGVYSEWGTHKEALQDLLMFCSSREKKSVTLDEYVSRMPEEQKYIYYAAGKSVEALEKMPQSETIADKGYEILYFTDEVDEFCVRMLMNYKEKEFKSVSESDIGIESGEKSEDDKELFEAIVKELGGKVKEARASERLKTHPVCLASGSGLSISMEKTLNMMPEQAAPKAEKILEINRGHAVFTALKAAHKSDDERFGRLVRVLFCQALLIEGLPIDDPVEYANDVCGLL